MYSRYRSRQQADTAEPPQDPQESHQHEPQNGCGVKVTFTYFPVRGRGEYIRLLGNYLTETKDGATFKDVVVDFEKWPELKPDTAFGTIPIADINDCTYGQSVAIARYMAEMAGLTGADSFSKAQIDSIVDEILDYREHVYKVVMKQNPQMDDDKKADLEVYMEQKHPFVYLDDKLKTDGHEFIAEKFSWADFLLYDVYYSQKELGRQAGLNFAEKFPYLEKHAAKMESLPELQNYLTTRPQYAF